MKKTFSKEARAAMSRGGRKGGLRRVQLHGNTVNPEVCAAGGRASFKKRGRAAYQKMRAKQPKYARVLGGQRGGATNAASGHMSALGQEYGPAQGQQNVESGLLASINADGGRAAMKSLTEKGRSRMGSWGAHCFWHLQQGKYSGACQYCLKNAKPFNFDENRKT